MKMRKVLGLAAGLLLSVAMVLSSCGAEDGGESESAPELPPAELVDELCYGYSIGVPDYYISNGIVIDKESKYKDRVSEIDGQAVLRITGSTHTRFQG